MDDARTGNAGRHDLLEMLVIALCTVLTGGEDSIDMAEFAATKCEFRKLEHGPPAIDQFPSLRRWEFSVIADKPPPRRSSAR